METEVANALTEDDFRNLAGVIHQHCGINLQDGKRELVRGRIAKQIRAGGFASAGEYLRHALADPNGRDFSVLIDSLSTNLTSFFRENDHFNYLSARFLPKLLERKRELRSNRIRGWSSACSTGEEPYSLAITLLEFLGQQGMTLADWDVKLLATDISTRVLRTAECGIYDKSRVASVPLHLQNKYLASQRLDGNITYAVTPALQQLVRFRHLNLIGNWPFSGSFDFIFCRNVMIYFDKPTQQRLVNRFYDHLEPGGLLFTGHSESLTGVSHPFRYLRPTIYIKA